MSSDAIKVGSKIEFTAVTVRCLKGEETVTSGTVVKVNRKTAQILHTIQGNHFAQTVNVPFTSILKVG